MKNNILMHFSKISISLLIVLFTLITDTNAQQDPYFSLYNYNMGILNPAFSGVESLTSINLNFRKQWAGVEGSPQTQGLMISAPINDRIGLGFSVVNDKVFVLNETDIYADFSYKLTMGLETDLFLGLKAGGSSINIDLISLGINDPLFSEDVSRFNPNFGMGAYLKNEKFYFHLSVPALLSSKRYEKEGVLVTKATDKAHIYAGGGYIFQLNNNTRLNISGLTKLVAGAPISTDISSIVSIQEKTELGISYRFNESISAIAMFKYIEWLHFGYAYEHTTSPVGDYSNGSHELLIKFLFLKK
ncbi:MAG: type IX secretion system membrane protein PorP/SprF [Bacteroidetes bacterium]|nr:type IX secretion system membrane protein PorP/SprF [Bacteroidota bacterium]